MDETQETHADQSVGKGQEFFDNTWLLLALGIGVPTIFYIAWALVDLLLL